MRYTTTVFLIFLLTGISQPYLRAQQPLSLDEALQLALKNSLQIQKQLKDLEATELNAGIQKGERLPVINLSVSSNYFSEINEIDLSQTIGVPGRSVALGGHDRSELILGIQQPLFTGFRLQSQVNLANTQIKNQQVQLQKIKNDLLLKVHLLFYQAQNLYKQKRILEASLKRLKVQMEKVRNFYLAAQAMAFDTLQVYNQILAIQIEQEKNAHNIRLLNLKMARLLNLEQIRPVAEAELPPPDADEISLEKLKKQARELRPEFQQIHLMQKSTEIQQRIARSTFYPNIMAFANFHYAKPGLDPVANSWMTYFTTGISLQWNLWRGGNDRRKIENLIIQNEKLHLEEEDLKRLIDTEVEESFENLQISLKNYHLSLELKNQQAERYRIVSNQYENGLASTLDLVTAELDLTRAELQTQQALSNYYMNLAKLKKAAGILHPLNED